MTHAGTITIGVDIDGEGLGAKLAADVRSQLAGLQTELNSSLGGLDFSKLGNMAAQADKATTATQKTAKSTDQLGTSARKATQDTDRLTSSARAAAAAQNVAADADDKVLKARDKLSNASGRAKTVEASLSNVRADGAKIAEKAAEVEDRLNHFKQNAPQLTEAIAQKERELAALRDKASALTQREIDLSERRSKAYRDEAAALRELENAQNRPPPSRGGGGRGGGGGGLLGGGSGAAIFNAGALAVGNIPAVTTAVVNLAGAVQTLAQAGGVIPGVWAAVGASLGTALIGAQGMKKAITDLTKAASSGDPKDLKKATEDLKDMAPAAVDTAKAVAQFLAGPWKDLTKNTQQTMFQGVDKTFNDLANKTMPTLSRGTAEVGSAWNKTFKELGRVGGLDSTQGFLDRIFGNAAEGQKRANAAIGPLIHAVGDLTAQSSNFVPRLADGLTNLSNRFDSFVTKSIQNGNFDKWVNEGITGVDHLGTTLLNVGKIFTDLTKAAGGDGGLLKLLDQGSTKLANFLGSTKGQAELSKFFADGRAELQQWLPVLKNLGPILGDILDASRQWSGILLPFLRDALGLLDRMPGLVQTAVIAFLAFKTLSPFAGLISDLGTVNSLLSKIPGYGGPIGAGGAAGKDGKGGAVTRGAGGILKGGLGSVLPGLALFAGGVAETPTDGSLTDSGHNQQAGLATVGGGALAGYEVAGPVGAVVGTLIGAGTALTQVFLDMAASFRNADKQMQDELAHRPPALPAEVAPTTGPNAPTAPGGGAAVAPPIGSVKPSATNLNNLLVPQALQGAQLGPFGSGVPIQVPNLQINGPAPAGITQSQFAQIDQAAKAATGSVDTLGKTIAGLPKGEVNIQNNTPDVIQALKNLGYAVQQLPNGHLYIQVEYRDPQGLLSVPSLGHSFGFDTASGKPLLGSGSAAGGVLPGYSPGRDNMLWPMSGGEGVVIPEAMRALGPNWLYNINSSFRSGISRRGYTMGGVVGFADGTGGVPLPIAPGDVGGDTVVGLLTQIRDLLAGKAGSSGPLAETAKATSSIADAAKGTGGQQQQLGPFGTPIKPHDPAYDAAAAAIQALGGDPEKFLGADPAQYFAQQGYGVTGTRGQRGQLLSGPPDYSQYASVLSAFATSGTLGPDLTGLGLDASSPVVRAITSARDKKKGGLPDDQIAALVNQVIGGGGYTGALDPSNASLISSLQSYRDKLAKQGGLPAIPAAGAAISPQQAAALNNQAGLSGNAQALIAFAQGANGGQYAPASDLAHGLADCSGAVSDLVEFLTKGQTTPGRLFTTSNEAQVLTSLGAVPGLVPGSLQIGVSPTHTAATLPNGVNFESGGSDGGVVYGGPVGAGDKQFTQQFSLPTDASGLNLAGLMPTAPGLAGPNLATSGSPVPVWIVGGGALPSQDLGQQAAQMFGKPLVDAAVQSGAQVASNVAGDFVDAAATTPLPGLKPQTLNAKPVSNDQLIKEQNPLALASLAGFQVPDFSRDGGIGTQDIMKNAGPGFDAQGNMFSDTASLIDRTFTSLYQQQQAQFQQELAVLNEIKTKVSQEVLEPIIKSAVQDAINGISNATLTKQGTAQGNAMAQPVATAVGKAVADNSSSSGSPDGGAVGGLVSGAGNAVLGGLFDEGGDWQSGTIGLNLSGSTERVLSPTETSAFDSGLLGGWNLQPLQQHYAATEGVDVTQVVGADFFGVSQVPIIGAIVNLLVAVLLKVIGVNITARDTLISMSKDVRDFRGQFEHFTAQGVLINDTSGLLDRSSSSEQEVADERIRILKIVIQGLVKFIIEQVIVPIVKAVANAAIQAGGAAAGAAINTQAPGAGGIVSSLIDGAGSAGVDVASQIGSEFGVALSQELVTGLFDGLQSEFPNLLTNIFSGAGLEALTNPLGGLLSDTIGSVLGASLPTALTTALSSIFNVGGFGNILSGLLGTGIGSAAGGGIFGGLLGLIAPLLDAGGLFDDGGVAATAGMLPKATVAPERVLSPRQTDLFEKMVQAGFTPGNNTTTLHASITVPGGPEAGKQVYDYLLSKLR